LRNATRRCGAPVLALDFDGVVVDALLECAAVTYVAGVSPLPRPVPNFASAVRDLPDQFVARFTEVRPYCRTLANFMVTNHVQRPIRNREQYNLARSAVAPGLLDHQATVGERLRSCWRSRDAALWLESHSVHPAVVDALRQWDGARWIVSAKDTESITAILRHHSILHLVDTIVGSCQSKVAVLQEASAHGDVLFIDDNLDHVLAASGALGVTARWARWGYSAPDDDQRARASGVEPFYQSDLVRLTTADLKDTHYG
jgi:phosphoglycolate phosphatase-like HAD superfamily hydrolase